MDVLNNEKNISTGKIETCTQARFPSSHENEKRTASDKSAKSPWARALEPLSDPITKTRPPGERFGRRNRLVEKIHFERTFRFGRRSNTKYFAMHYRENTAGLARLGVAVGRRVAGKACRRNRIKRALRETFRHNVNALPSIDIVVLARPACGMLMRKRLNQEAAALIETLLVDRKNQTECGG